MTFRDYLFTLEGCWVIVYTIDSIVDSDGDILACKGRLTVHEDFVVIKSVDGTKYAVPMEAITTVVLMSDQKEMDNREADEQARAKRAWK